MITTIIILIMTIIITKKRRNNKCNGKDKIISLRQYYQH